MFLPLTPAGAGGHRGRSSNAYPGAVEAQASMSTCVDIPAVSPLADRGVSLPPPWPPVEWYAGATLMDETLFAWVHISDIHFGHGDAGHKWDQGLVLERLRLDLPAAMKLGAPRPDAILVTGDVAFSGGPDEYAKADAWLRELGTT